jgi:nucleoside-diphosphate-sugar epimerase
MQKSSTAEVYIILVTGAAGLNGSAVVHEFSRNSVSVRALVRDRSNASTSCSVSSQQPFAEFARRHAAVFAVTAN